MINDAREKAEFSFILVSYNYFRSVVCLLFVCLATRILVPQPEIKPGALAVRVWNHSYWTPGEFPENCFIKLLSKEEMVTMSMKPENVGMESIIERAQQLIDKNVLLHTLTVLQVSGGF